MNNNQLRVVLLENEYIQDPLVQSQRSVYYYRTCFIVILMTFIIIACCILFAFIFTYIFYRNLIF